MIDRIILALGRLPVPLGVFFALFAFSVTVCAAGWAAWTALTWLATATSPEFAACAGACLLVPSIGAFLVMEPKK